MLDEKFYTKSGSLKPYGFACGYVEKHTIQGQQLTLEMQHNVYHFKGFIGPKRIWQCDDTLTGIRKQIADLRREHK